jgi:hypothetical protein
MSLIRWAIRDTTLQFRCWVRKYPVKIFAVRVQFFVDGRNGNLCKEKKKVFKLD